MPATRTMSAPTSWRATRRWGGEASNPLPENDHLDRKRASKVALCNPPSQGGGGAAGDGGGGHTTIAGRRPPPPSASLPPPPGGGGSNPSRRPEVAIDAREPLGKSDIQGSSAKLRGRNSGDARC